MSKFTEAKPFEFEGNWVGRRNESGQVVASFRGHTASIFSREGAEFCHAFVEAENNEWHEDGDGFRKGRWFVDDSERPYVYVSHLDLPGEAWACFDLYNWDRGTPNAVRAVGASFHAWHAATYPEQPEKPHAFGSRVRLGAMTYCLVPVDGEKDWIRGGDGGRCSWTELTSLGLVTVLSEGVVQS